MNCASPSTAAITLRAGVCLFHRSVVDRVMRLTPPPEGLRFIPVPEWNDSAAFR